MSSCANRRWRPAYVCVLLASGWLFVWVRTGKWSLPRFFKKWMDAFRCVQEPSEAIVTAVFPQFVMVTAHCADVTGLFVWVRMGIIRVRDSVMRETMGGNSGFQDFTGEIPLSVLLSSISFYCKKRMLLVRKADLAWGQSLPCLVNYWNGGLGKHFLSGDSRFAQTNCCTDFGFLLAS